MTPQGINQTNLLSIDLFQHDLTEAGP